jgi:NADPH-dependent 2,4-dienoyl-CoA reductase/sulfur reductase-like enzyme
VTARRRGHQVVLFERQPVLGGQMRIAALGPGRGELQVGVDYLEREARRLGVDLRLGAEATAEMVLAERPDAVLVATGSSPLPFDAVAAGARVFSVQDVLLGVAEVGARVLAIDGLGRIAASSAAETLARAGHQVTLLSRDYAVAINVDQTTRPAVIRRLRECGVREMSGTEVLRYEGTTARLRDTFTGHEWTEEGVDTLVYDLGGRADDRLYHDLKKQEIAAQRIGDCLAPRDLEEAYHEGFRAALAL